jgi:hypothetical protein
MIDIGILDENNVLTNTGTAEQLDESVINVIDLSTVSGYATVGYTYNAELNAFIPPKPFPSYVLDEVNFWWSPPKAYPASGNNWYWNEDILDWEERAE